MEANDDIKNTGSRSLAENAAFNIIRVVFTLLFPVIVFPYISRRLGPSSLGSVDFAQSVVAYFAMIASMGIPAYGKIICSGARHSEEKLKKTICELLYLSFALEIIAFSALVISIFAVPEFYRYRVLLMLNSATILVSGISVEWIFFALERFSYTAVRAIAIKIASVLLIFAMVHAPDDYIKYTFINVLSVVATAIMDFSLAHKYIHFYRLSELNIRRHLGPVIAFFASSVAVTINTNTDIVMLNFMKGEQITGLYTFSGRIKSMLVSLMVAWLDAAIPRLSMLYRTGDAVGFRSLLRSVGLFTFAAGCAASSFFIVFSEETVIILGGTEYLPAAGIVTALMLCMPVLAVNFILGYGVLLVSEREKQYACTMMITCLVNIAANFVLIPVLGAEGAALATLASEIGNMLLYYRFGKDCLGDAFKECHLLKIAALSIITGAVCWIGKGLILTTHPLLQMILFLAVYLTIYLPCICLISNDARDILIRAADGVRSRVKL